MHPPPVVSHGVYVLFALPIPAITCKMTLSTKPEVRNASQRQQNNTEPVDSTLIATVNTDYKSMAETNWQLL